MKDKRTIFGLIKGPFLNRQIDHFWIDNYMIFESILLQLISKPFPFIVLKHVTYWQLHENWTNGHNFISNLKRHQTHTQTQKESQLHRLFKKVHMSYKYLLALKGVLIFCRVVNTLLNVIAKLLNISCNWDDKTT